MSQWHQHYYTWSTKSLSGNKVGLGIVAASEMDRDYLRLADTESAKCEPCRSEKAIMIERMNYSTELKGFLRSGTSPSEQGTDRRNNKFVHMFSSPWMDFRYPEDYLCPLPYKTKWEGQNKLVPVNTPAERKGRKLALRILKQYGLENQLSLLFYDIYHCLLTSEKPLYLVDSLRSAKDFDSFSREIMILIHYLLPESLRKDADYVSFVSETTQEAHFLFSNQPLGKYNFSISGGNKKRDYVLLEKEFFDLLADAFRKEDGSFEKYADQINGVLERLADKRNQLEKCIYTLMAPYAGKQKEKEEYFSSMEKLMYWARKDQSLIKPLEDSMKELDFLQMEEEQLFAYTKLMLTGAGGKTKEFVFQQLYRMLNYYFENDKDIFWELIFFIRENHGSLYEELLAAGDRGFTKDVLYAPIKDLSNLEYAAKYHKNFFDDLEYRDHYINSAYYLYRTAQKEETRAKIQSLGKAVDEGAFIQRKKEDVESVIKLAGALDEFLSIIKQMDLDNLEHPIHAFLFRRAIFFVKQESQLSSEEEGILQNLATLSDMEKDMEKEIEKCHERGLADSIHGMTPQNMLDSFFMEKRAIISVKSQPADLELTGNYTRVKNNLLAKRYCDLLKEQGNTFYSLDTTNWIRFVLTLSDEIRTDNHQLAQKMIQETKKLIIKKNDLVLLAHVNHTLKNNGTASIHCPETLWETVNLDSVESFQAIYERIHDISLVRCEKSEIYRKAKKLYELADHYRGETEEKVLYAWQQYNKKHANKANTEIEDNPWRKVLSFAIDDMLSKSIWAVLLGFYGFLFVTIREKIAIMPGYNPSVVMLVLLVIIYAGKSFVKNKMEETPGSIIYVMGVGILLMNWGLALDTTGGISVLYIVAFALAIGAKVFHYIFFTKQKDE